MTDQDQAWARARGMNKTANKLGEARNSCLDRMITIYRDRQAQTIEVPLMSRMEVSVNGWRKRD